MIAPASFSLPRRLASAWEGWNRFWFRPASPLGLGLIRILTGCLALYIHLAYTVDLDEFFGAHAWIGAEDMRIIRQEQPVPKPWMSWENPPPSPPPSSAQEKQLLETWDMPPDQVLSHGASMWSIWFHVTDPRAMWTIHGIVLLCLFLFTIGLFTPVTSVLSWIGMISYVQRSPTSLFGLDTMMNILVLYLIIGQSGAALSVDRLIQRYVRTRRALEAGRTRSIDLSPQPRISANLGIRLLQVNLCCIYFVSGLSKLAGASWWQMNAVWLTMANPEFSPLYFPPFYALLSWLCSHRLLWEIAISGASLFTLFTEISFAFLVWLPRWRFLMMTLALLMHTGIAVFMGLNTFSMAMGVMLLSFLPPSVIDAVLAKLRFRAPSMTLLFDPNSPRQRRAVACLRAVDVLEQISLEPATPPLQAALKGNGRPKPCPALTLEEASGTRLSGPEARNRILAGLRLLRPIAWLFTIPPLSRVGTAAFATETRSSEVPLSA
jgi:hypothetical protein